MVFVVGVMYDLASTSELKSKGLPQVDVFLNSDASLLLLLPLYIILFKTSTQKPYLQNMKRLMLILFLSILITMGKTRLIGSRDSSMQSRCLVKSCNKTVLCNQKLLVCEHCLCLEMCHVKCSNHHQSASNKVYESCQSRSQKSLQGSVSH